LIGYDEYRWISSELPYTAFAGDWAFTAALYGEQPARAARYAAEILQGTWRLPNEAIRQVLRVRALTAPFLDHCLAAVPWGDYALVGFTSTFEQNIASLALARRIKALHPSIAVVFGGANWEGEMGEELHRQFPFVDYVCSGESEKSLPALARRVLTGAPVEGIPPGVVYRDGGRSVSTGPPALVQDLDELPVPDFADYFHDLNDSTGGASVVPLLLFESSRGCWWGAKSHCTFCGLNGGSMAFRRKSARRALEELQHLVGRWGLDHVEAVDNILDMRYFEEFLPALARLPRPLELFYEVKANLTRAQVRALRAAGVRRIQPGIESLSDHVLKLMRKGTTGLRNIQLLRWCKEEGICVEWNLLYGFPGETRADYDSTLRLLPAIRFLQPPGACGPVRLDRFSPYHTAPAAHGLRNIRPQKIYEHLYPFAPADALRRIAYYFDYDYEPAIDPTGYAEEVIASVEDWRRAPETGTLHAIRRPDALVLLDTRSDAVAPRLTLAGPERAAYEYCDEVRSAAGVLQHLHRTFPGATFDEGRVRACLDSLVSHRLMVSDGTNYLSLAIPAAQPSPRPEPAPAPIPKPPAPEPPGAAPAPPERSAAWGRRRASRSRRRSSSGRPAGKNRTAGPP
jgi:ribosomal peptide maturation radical SAM protein 1